MKTASEVDNMGSFDEHVAAADALYRKARELAESPNVKMEEYYECLERAVENYERAVDGRSRGSAGNQA